MSPIGAVRILCLLAVGLASGACGSPRTPVRTATAVLTITATVGGGNIVSGAAVGSNVPGLASPARPALVIPSPGDIAAAVDGTCPDTHPIKVGRDTRAYEPSRADYAAIPAVECYTTLAAAAANGYQAADQSP